MPSRTKQQLIEDSLTPRQREIRDWIKDFILSQGYGPSVREIGEAVGISSTNGVHIHLKALAKKGAMQQAKKDGRSLARAYIFPQEAKRAKAVQS